MPIFETTTRYGVKEDTFTGPPTLRYQDDRTYRITTSPSPSRRQPTKSSEFTSHDRDTYGHNSNRINWLETRLSELSQHLRTVTQEKDALAHQVRSLTAANGTS